VSETATALESEMRGTSVEDRLMIRDLYDRFYWALNTGGEGQMECFAPGAQIERGGVGDTVGPETSVEAAEKWAQDPVGVTYQHHVTNVIIDPHPDGDEDKRAVRIYFLITAVENPPDIKVRWSCRAFDTVQKVDGRWRFLRRRIQLNHQGTA
jgi:SnoaL-like domain